MANQAAISLEPEAFVQGGLLSDVDVEITELQFCGWDYDGAMQDEVLAVKATLTVLDEHGKPDPQSVVDQYWSAGGKFGDCGVTEDGYRLIPSATKTGLTKGSNFHHLVTSLRANGMPEGYLADGNLQKLKSLRMHITRVAIKREGLANTNRRGDQQATTVVCSRILWGPWEGKKAAGAGAGGTRTRAQAAPAAAAAAAGKTNGAAAAQAAQAAPAAPASTAADNGAGGDDIEALALAGVTQILNGNDNMMGSVKDLKVAVFRLYQKTQKSEIRNAICKMVEDTNWLEANGFGIVDGAVIAGE